MRVGFATWRPSPNFYAKAMAAQPMGVVLHIEQGPEAACIATFTSATSQVSAHFSVSRTGAASQYVDTVDAAWAEAAGNLRWISIEHEGVTGEPLTDAQIATDGQIIAALQRGGYTFPLTISDSPLEEGIGWHGMGGADWGNHPNCPGEPVKAQRPLIIAATLADLNPQPQPEEDVDYGVLIATAGQPYQWLVQGHRIALGAATAGQVQQKLAVPVITAEAAEYNELNPITG